MIEAGIFSGDILVVDRAAPVRHGCVVVAVLNGEFTVIDTEKHILAMCYAHEGRISAFVHNLSDRKVEFRIPVPLNNGDANRPLVCLQSNQAVPPDENGQYDLVLEPHGYRWFRLGGLEDMIAEDGPSPASPIAQPLPTKPG